MKSTTKALVFVILAAIAGSSVPVVGKYALEVFKPFTLVMLRFFFASLVLVPFVLRNKDLSLDKFKNLLPVATVGALNPICLFIALQFTNASIAPLIYASVPAMTAVYLFLVEKKYLKLKQIIGVALGFIGVIGIVVLPLIESKGYEISILGNLIIVLASLAFMFYGILSKKKQKNLDISPLALTFYFSLVTFLVAVPFSVLEIASNGLHDQLNLLHIVSAVWIGIVGTGVFYFSYQLALKLSGEITASLFTFLQPVFGIILAGLILQEQITIPFIVGGVLAVLGAKIASR